MLPQDQKSTAWAIMSFIFAFINKKWHAYAARVDQNECSSSPKQSCIAIWVCNDCCNIWMTAWTAYVNWFLIIYEPIIATNLLRYHHQITIINLYRLKNLIILLMKNWNFVMVAIVSSLHIFNYLMIHSLVDVWVFLFMIS